MQNLPPLTFGTLLKRYRRAAGLTQAELAERAGFSVVYVSMLERAVRQPVRATVDLLAHALALSPEDLHTLEVSAHLASRRLLLDRQAAGSSAPPRLPMGGFLGAAPEGPIVGRQADLTQLLSALDVVTAGAGSLLLLVGEPGVGKTRLAQEVAMMARRRGHVVTTGSCYEPQAGTAYYPFFEVLRVAYAGAPAVLRAEVPQRYPDIALLLRDQGVDIPALDTPSRAPGDQQRLLWQVTGFLQTLAEERSVTLLLDDLQWADHASIDLLVHLAHHTRTSPILLLGTVREEEVRRHPALEGALRDLVRDHLLERVRVRRLSFEATRTLIAGTLGIAEVSDEFGQRLYVRTEGNPFYTREIVRALVEQDAAFTQAGDGGLQALENLDLPESVRSVIAHRVGHLSPAARELLGEASVLGQAFAFVDLLHMSERHEEQVEAALEEGTGAGLLYEAPGARFGFHHALIQEVLYQGLSAPKRRRLHRKAGEAIERLPERVRPHRAADLSYHFLAADEGARALPYMLLAGDQAEALYAHSEAENHYRRAADVAGELGDMARAAEAQEKLGNVQFFVARADDALEAYGRAAQAYRSIGDNLGLRRVTVRLALTLGHKGDLEQGRAQLQALLETNISGEPASSVADMYVDLAWLCSDPHDRLAACARAAELARAAGDDRILARAEFIRGNTLLTDLGRIAEARQTFEHIVPLLEAAGDLRRLCSTLTLIADSCMRSGEFDTAQHYVSRALGDAERVGVPAQVAWIYCNRGEIAYYTGNWQQAYADFERADAIYRGDDLVAESGYARWGMGLVCLARGQAQQASGLLEEAIRCAETHDDNEIETLQAAHVALAERDLMGGHATAARDRLEPLLKQLQHRQGLATRALPMLAWTYLALGDADHAQSLIQDARAAAASGSQRLVMVDALRVAGLIAMESRQWSEAASALEEALALSQAMAYPYAEAKVLYTLGLLHMQQEDFATARTHLRAANHICARLGEQLYREHVAVALTAVQHARVSADVHVSAETGDGTPDV